MKIKDSILHMFTQFNDLSVKEIEDSLLVSKQAIHYALNQLLENNSVEKFGRTPKTIYRLKKEKPNQYVDDTFDFTTKEIEQFNNKVLVITEVGEMLTGLAAFSYWCNQRHLPLKKTAIEYLETQKKYQHFVGKNKLIDGTDKLINTKGYDHIYLDKLYYCDFYAIERFGKTRLGTLLHYAKQGQNKMLMKILVDEIKTDLLHFIKQSKADAVGFVPPTIRREVQIMKFIETQLKIALPIIKINKISGIIPVPQKSLNKLNERIRNADNTFAVTSNNNYKQIILIDDAVGSGSTLNQIAAKIKNKNPLVKITGVAIVGSFKVFDVITDV